jgi:hypothetical protein
MVRGESEENLKAIFQRFFRFVRLNSSSVVEVKL